MACSLYANQGISSVHPVRHVLCSATAQLPQQGAVGHYKPLEAKEGELLRCRGIIKVLAGQSMRLALQVLMFA